MRFTQLFAPDDPSRRVTLLVLIIASIAYPIYCSVPAGIGMIERLQVLLEPGGAERANPILLAVVLFVGMWPVAFANLLYLDERRNARWAFLAAFLFAQSGMVLPLLLYRLIIGPVSGSRRPPGALAAWVESRTHLVLFSAVWLLSLAFAFQLGYLADYLSLFRSDREVHLLTWNFFLWCASFGFFADEDLRRRPGGESRSPGMAAALRVPLFNVLVQLWFRPKLPDPTEVRS